MQNSMILEFEVNKQTLKRVDKLKPVANSKGYLYAHFKFDNDWIGARKEAIFSYNDYYIHTKIDDANICEILKEVIKAPKFGITIRGYLDDRIITTNMEYISVLDTFAGEGEEPLIRNVVSKSLVVRKEGDTIYIDLPNMTREVEL